MINWDSFLQTWNTKVRHFKKTRRILNCHYLPSFRTEKEAILWLYLKSKSSIKVAKVLGVSPHTVKKILLKCAVDLVNSPNQNPSKLSRLKLKNYTAKEAADKVGCTASNVRAYAKRNKIQLKKVSRSTHLKGE